MSGSTNTTVDENIKRIFYKSRQFVEDALEQGNMSIQTEKAIAGYFLDRVQHGDPVAEQFMKMACLHLDNKDFKRETVSPDEEALFQKLLTRWENRELEL